MKKILFAAFAIATIFSSCEEKEPKIDISNEKALMDKRWKVVNIKRNPNVNDANNYWQDITTSTAPCVLDNRLQFITKSDVVFDEYYAKCTQSDPQTMDLKYNIENENYIKIYSNPANIDGSIWRSGAFKLVDIENFTIDERTPQSDPNIVVSVIYTYQKVQN